MSAYTRNGRSHTAGTCPTWRSLCLCASVVMFLPAAIALLASGCADRPDFETIRPVSVSGGRYVQSLGNLRTGQPPTPTQAKLSEFFFGTEPDAPIGLVKPVDIAATAEGLLISDSALQSVMSWSAGGATLDFHSAIAPGKSPNTLAVMSNGDLLIGDLVAGVSRVNRGGGVVARFQPPDALRVGGVCEVGGEVWVTNTLLHRIEVFDAASGRFVRSIGRRGRGPGEFGIPLGMAVTPASDICVVDMLNARVQLLTSGGVWKRDIGGPGDRIGHFGRPKDVAVGPDGTIFVTDAAMQCVQAFDRAGRALIAFGGAADERDALVLPAGIAIHSGAISADRVPESTNPSYYVLVAEQIVRPGVRVYAWSGQTRLAAEDREPLVPKVRTVASSVTNPHWRPQGCRECHGADSPTTVATSADQVDSLCLKCHDGKKAIDEAHPIGRAAHGRGVKIPGDWPLVGDKLGCITCHDIRGHCTASVRPDENPAFVRGFESTRPFETCTHCHVAENWRVNPHKGQIAGLANATTACGQCHKGTPANQPGGGAIADAPLRAATTALCLNCHKMHADPAPNGHLGKPVTAAMTVALPLDNGQISCATCHNPHQSDGHYSLRLEQTNLCRTCHMK